MSNPVRRLSAAVTAGAMSAVVLSSLISGTAAHAAAPVAYAAPMQASPSGTYTVRSGDTLSGIAARHGVSLAAIFAANNMNMRTVIHPGQTIKVGPATTAAPTPQPAPAVPAAATSHTVKPGDTLSAIASKHGVSLASVLAANNLQMRSIIYPGQTIKLTAVVTTAPTPQPSPAMTTAPAVTASAASHTVKSGDTLGAIASKYGVSLASVLAANNLQMRSIIYPGQTIKLTAATTTASAAPATVAQPAPATPTAPASGTTYTVKSGDTLSKIASAHGVSLSTVLQANGMTLSTVIYPGQKIKIGSSAAPAPSTPVAPSASPSAAELKTMVADTARRMGVDPSLALAIAMQESSFRQNVTSSAGAIGTMQIMPTSGEWAAQIVGRPLDLRNAQDNVTAGVAIISALLATSPSTDIAIASYYQGQYSVMNRGMYEDTKDYVASVLKHQKSFK